MQDLVAQLHSEGYALVRGFFPREVMDQIRREAERVHSQALLHHATYRDKNLLFEILDDPKAGRRVVLQAHWTAWISPYLERMRRDPRYLALLEPLLGADIKQMAHQIHWKPPGAKYTFYRFHQDARFRNSDATRNLLYGNINTGLAIDPQTAANGALQVIPKSHLRGYLGLSEDGSIMTGNTPADDLRRVGLDPETAVTCEMEPGDLLLWTLYTVHGSAPNIAGKGIANPMGAILTVGMMFEFLGWQAEAQAIDAAVRAALREGKTPAELGGTLPTRQVGDWVANRVSKSGTAG